MVVVVLLYGLGGVMGCGKKTTNGHSSRKPLVSVPPVFWAYKGDAEWPVVPNPVSLFGLPCRHETFQLTDGARYAAPPEME
jgi:hypothetical protein